MPRHDPPPQPGEALRCRTVLERLLAPIDPGPAAAAAADALIAEFGSLPALLAAPEHVQLRIAGDARIVALLQAVRLALRRATHVSLRHRPLLGDSPAVNAYLAVHMAHEANEQVRVLYLDSGRRLIRDELLTVGTPDAATFCIRSIVARTLELGATRLIVAHNHPSGILEASRADVAATRALEGALDVLGVVLLDHRIVAAGGSISVLAPTHGHPRAGLSRLYDRLWPRSGAGA